MKKTVKILEDYELPWYGQNVTVVKVPPIEMTEEELASHRIGHKLPRMRTAENDCANEGCYKTVPMRPPYYDC